MGFLIKSAFWLSLVLLMIPFGSHGDENGEPLVGPIDTFLAARGAIQDISGMCERRPDVCAYGHAAFQTISVRARQGARIAMEMMDEPDAPVVGAATDDAIVTGTVPPADQAAAAQPTPGAVQVRTGG